MLVDCTDGQVYGRTRVRCHQRGPLPHAHTFPIAFSISQFALYTNPCIVLNLKVRPGEKIPMLVHLTDDASNELHRRIVPLSITSPLNPISILTAR